MTLRRWLLTGLLLTWTCTMLQAGAEPAKAWEVGVVAATADENSVEPVPIELQRASYEVSVLGPNALGVLRQELVHPGETDAVVAFLLKAPEGTIPNDLVVTIDGIPVEDALLRPDDEPEPQPVRPGQRGRQAQKKPVDLQAQRTKPFTVPAGSQVVVTSSFRVELPFHDGTFRLRLPAVSFQGPSMNGERAHLETVLPRGEIEVAVIHDRPLLRAESSTHNIISGFDRDRTWVELADRDEHSRPFELTFAIGDNDDSTFVGYVGPEVDGEREVTLVFTPAIEPDEESVRAKEMLFVLDTSGSMEKQKKLPNAKGALASCLDKLGSADRFNLAEFDAGFTLFRPESVLAEENRASAHSWLAGQAAHGATHLLPALEAVLDQPVSDEHHRMIVVLSDGILADEKEVLELLEDKLGDARLFAVGIGKTVRQDTMLRLSEYGRGTAVFVDEPDELQSAVAGLFDSIADPLAWDLELDWAGADVELIDTYRLPDLYAARPVTVKARARGDLPSEVLLQVTTTEGVRTFRAALPVLSDVSMR